MPITFSCPCGKTLRVPDEYAGRRAKCPGCGELVNIPGPEPVFEVEEKPKPGAASPAKSGSNSAKPVDDEDEGGTYKISRD